MQFSLQIFFISGSFGLSDLTTSGKEQQRAGDSAQMKISIFPFPLDSSNNRIGQTENLKSANQHPCLCMETKPASLPIE
jgi:hypothetical protein